jgi:glutamate-1-semialdehyde 2,1-aminomutase
MTTSQNQAELFERSKKMVPGGVHSPVRSFKGLHTTPRFIERALGAQLWDVEQKDYIDFCMSFGPLILGHRHPEVEETLHVALKRGWSYGASEPYSLELAEFLLNKLPFVDQLRFVNSGTEAVMTALRLARGVTKRSKILKFNGCYHGHVDSMLIKAGSGLAGEAEASSAGVPEGVSRDTLILELGDREGVEECFKREGEQIAALIIEPLPANNGLLIQNTEFLAFCREITKKYGALLIFDEVISGFRVAFGGMVEKTQVIPDIVTYGKIIGGGLPVGALAAKKNIMEHLAPLGSVYQAGTLSANPLAMAAGLATLKLCTPELYTSLEKRTQEIVDLFSRWCASYNQGQFKHIRFVRYGSLFWCHGGAEHPRAITEITDTLGSDFKPLFEVLLERGIYLAPNAYEVGFVSAAHTADVIGELERRLF